MRSPRPLSEILGQYPSNNNSNKRHRHSIATARLGLLVLFFFFFSRGLSNSGVIMCYVPLLSLFALLLVHSTECT